MDTEPEERRNPKKCERLQIGATVQRCPSLKVDNTRVLHEIGSVFHAFRCKSWRHFAKPHSFLNFSMTDTNSEKFDAMLLAIAQQCDGITEVRT